MTEMTKGMDAIKDVPVSNPAEGIAAIALNLAVNYHGATVIKDGTMYQQLKLEQKDVPNLTLDMVLETAERFEKHLLSAPERIAALLAVVIGDMDIVAEDE